MVRRGLSDATGSWNSGEHWDRIDDLSKVMPIDDGSGDASVALDKKDTAALAKLAARTKSDPASNPVTGAELKPGVGAGRTIRGDKGGAPDIEAAPAMAEKEAPKTAKKAASKKA